MPRLYAPPVTERPFRAAGAARALALCLAVVFMAGVVTAAPPTLERVPELDRFCLEAQRIVTRTEHPFELVVHDNFDAFVKSKAIIEGPQIQQFNWYRDGKPVGVSCKLKSADHLNLTFGDGTAGPDGLCQDMNRAVYALLQPESGSVAYARVIFDARETVSNEEQPGMTGPDWLAPYRATWADADGALHVRAKGFVVNFTDPRFEKAPPRFRGVHYCHLLAPAYFAELLEGAAAPGVVLGREVDTSGPRPENTARE